MIFCRHDTIFSSTKISDIYRIYVVDIYHANPSVLCFAVSAAELHYTCVHTINCTEISNTGLFSNYLPNALDLADANKYMCTKDNHPGETNFYLFLSCLTLYSIVF